MVESMQQSSANPKNQDVGRGFWKIAACSQPCFLASTVFGTVSSLHPISNFYTCFTHFSLAMSISGLPSLALYMVLSSFHGWLYLDLWTLLVHTRTHYIAIYAHSLDLSAELRMREIKLVTCKWRRILQKLLDLTKSPSERYKLHQRIMYNL